MRCEDGSSWILDLTLFGREGAAREGGRKPKSLTGARAEH